VFKKLRFYMRANKQTMLQFFCVFLGLDHVFLSMENFLVSAPNQSPSKLFLDSHDSLWGTVEWI